MKKGFTLIEVCLVLLLFGVAVTSLMALFPVSLRQGNMAVSDSMATTFADYVLNALAANAAGEAMKNPDKWKDAGTFEECMLGKGGNSDVSNPILIDVGGGPGTGVRLAVGDHKIEKYLGMERTVIRYSLAFDRDTRFGEENFEAWKLYRATLRVTDNPAVRNADGGALFITYFAYLGEVPR